MRRELSAHLRGPVREAIYLGPHQLATTVSGFVELRLRRVGLGRLRIDGGGWRAALSSRERGLRRDDWGFGRVGHAGSEGLDLAPTEGQTS